MTGTEFDEATFKKAIRLYTERVASFVFDVNKRKGKGKTHRVHTDVVLYAYGPGELRASFAYCTCPKGVSCADRVCTCEHVLAVFMTVAGLTEEGDELDEETEFTGPITDEDDNPGGSWCPYQRGTPG